MSGAVQSWHSLAVYHRTTLHVYLYNRLNSLHNVLDQQPSSALLQVPQFLYESGYGLTHDLVTTTAAAAAGDGGDSGDASGQQLRAKLLASASSSLAPPPPLYRGLPGLIAVTQPRRVAATAMAARVANELGFKLGPQHDGKGSSSNNSKNGGSSGSGVSHVGYQVRYDTSTVSSKHTRIKFCTDGILLREIQSDLLLRKYRWGQAMLIPFVQLVADPSCAVGRARSCVTPVAPIHISVSH